MHLALCQTQFLVFGTSQNFIFMDSVPVLIIKQVLFQIIQLRQGVKLHVVAFYVFAN